ncbi:hypothetical protein PHYSODRAFT_302134 [Phytophthora sojae]|uniref:Uncharacterized protein n=1 Tax=Phytophthora sojae (strain P6497) TaxID=1094619 RepID=G4ZN85_PHYSP|nr:hypothetical protein PHYSODRAFT_302134 [Phytophthora sojae]EGZ15695.1 hypothetical protein PHYSODRAFT_302134 [Phytophthora sojae]|eukprot:XP_009529444.1 hypothetical protein PHYSODRAFT_302134 [Phytophthora sojae]
MPIKTRQEQYEGRELRNTVIAHERHEVFVEVQGAITNGTNGPLEHSDGSVCSNCPESDEYVEAFDVVQWQVVASATNVSREHWNGLMKYASPLMSSYRCRGIEELSASSSPPLSAIADVCRVVTFNGVVGDIQTKVSPADSVKRAAAFG